jgi:PEGA domain
MPGTRRLDRPGRLLHLCAFVPLCLCACLFTGCLHRSLSVTSEPSGAQLIVNGEAAGNTPARLRFHHHGVYRVELRKPGYQPVVEGLRLGPKFYERMPIDFVTDVLWPGKIIDDRKVHYSLKKTPPFDKARVLAAARTAATEAEKVIPRLYAEPTAKQGGKPRPGAKKKPKPKPEEPRAPKSPGKKPGQPKPGDLDEPPPVPEIEAGRAK